MRMLIFSKDRITVLTRNLMAIGVMPFRLVQLTPVSQIS